MIRLPMIRGEAAHRAADRALGIPHPSTYSEGEASGYWAAVKNPPTDTWANIDAAAYRYALEILPPIYFPAGFAVREPMTHRDDGAAVHLCILGDEHNARAAYRTLAEMRRT